MPPLTLFLIGLALVAAARIWIALANRPRTGRLYRWRALRLPIHRSISARRS